MASFFTTILDLFKRDGGGGSVLGIDVGSSAIKFVQLRKKGGQAILETYGALALGPYAKISIGRATRLPHTTLAEALRDLLREAKATTKSCAFAIPLSSSLISFLKMPAVDSRQLSQMIPIEARKYIPVPITEVALDWWVIPHAETEEATAERAPTGAAAPLATVSVLVVAIHNDTLRKFQEISTGSGLETSFFELEVFSTIRSVIERTLEAVMVFDMGAATTKLSILTSGILQYSHTINRGSQDLSVAASQSLNISVDDAERLKRGSGLSDASRTDLAEIFSLNLDYIWNETNRVLAVYGERYQKSIARVILTGGGVLLKGLLPLAKETLHADVVLGNPFSRVRAPAFLEPVLAEAGPEFAVALGIALRKLHEQG